jgi:endoglucanase
MINLRKLSIDRLLPILAVALAGLAAANANPLPLHTSGNRLLDSCNRPVILGGVNVPGLEWSAIGTNNVHSTEIATGYWHARIIRVPLSEDRWFGKAPDSYDDGTNYRELVKDVVETARANGAYTILDLHWNDADEWGKNIGQHKMPDQHSLLFWKSLASTYANVPWVLFDLYNETHDVSWDIWRDGGQVTDAVRGSGSKTYQAAGMQQVLDTIRSTGARNVCLVGGLDWAADFTCLYNGHALKDHNGNGLIYSYHYYTVKRYSVNDWAGRMKKAARLVPVIVGEFGNGPRGLPSDHGTQWIRHVFEVIQDSGYSWTAWSFHPSAGPTILRSFNYEPTPAFGVYVKDALAGNQITYDPRAKVNEAPAPQRFGGF